MTSKSAKERPDDAVDVRFELPFDEIAPMVGRSTEATRQLASRARRRVNTRCSPTLQREGAEVRLPTRISLVSANALESKIR